jgi:hypothetical protein
MLSELPPAAFTTPVRLPRGLFYEHAATGRRHPPKQQNEQDTEKAQEPEAPERVHVGEQRRLLDQNVVGAGHRLPRRSDGPQSMRGKSQARAYPETIIGILVRDTRSGPRAKSRAH